MGKHKQDDYKLHAIKHYLKNGNYVPNSKSDAKNSLLCRYINGAMNIWKKMT